MYAVGELLHMVRLNYYPWCFKLCIIDLCRLAMPYAVFILLHIRAAHCFGLLLLGLLLAIYVALL